MRFDGNGLAPPLFFGALAGKCRIGRADHPRVEPRTRGWIDGEVAPPPAFEGMVGVKGREWGRDAAPPIFLGEEGEMLTGRDGTRGLGTPPHFFGGRRVWGVRDRRDARDGSVGSVRLGGWVLGAVRRGGAWARRSAERESSLGHDYRGGIRGRVGTGGSAGGRDCCSETIRMTTNCASQSWHNDGTGRAGSQC